MAKLKAFLFGAWEFRSDFTMSFDDPDLMEAYDKGRDFAHRVTFRFFDE